MDAIELVSIPRYMAFVPPQHSASSRLERRTLWWRLLLVVPHNQNFSETWHLGHLQYHLKQHLQPVICQDHSCEAIYGWRNQWQEEWIAGFFLQRTKAKHSIVGRSCESKNSCFTLILKVSIQQNQMMTHRAWRIVPLVVFPSCIWKDPVIDDL